MKYIIPFCQLAILLVCACAGFNVAGDVQTGRMALIRGEPAAALARFQRAAEQDPTYVADFTPLQEGVWTYVGRAHYEQRALADARTSFGRALSINQKDFMARLYLGLTIIRLAEEKKAVNALSLDDILFALREGVDPKRMAALIAEKGIDFDFTVEAENNLRRAGADNPLLQRIRAAGSESTAKRANMPSRDQGRLELETSLKECLAWLEYLIASTTEGRYWDPGGQIRSRIRTTLAQISRKETEWQNFIANGERIGSELEEEADRARQREQRDIRPGLLFE